MIKTIGHGRPIHPSVKVRMPGSADRMAFVDETGDGDQENFFLFCAEEAPVIGSRLRSRWRRVAARGVMKMWGADPVA